MKAANWILESNKIYIYGFGGNSNIIKIFINYLIRLGINVFYSHDRDDQLAYSNIKSEKSIHLIVSYKLRDNRWNKIIKNIEQNQNKIIFLGHESNKIEKINNKIYLNFIYSEGFLFDRDNAEITMLTILMLIVEKLIITMNAKEIIKSQDVYN